jgi:hypothetical protein
MSNPIVWQLFLDDERYPSDTLGITCHIARNYDDAVWYVQHYGPPVFISFDHDLGSPQNLTGMDFAKWLCNQVMNGLIQLPDDFMFYVHSQNPVGAKNIQTYMDQFLKDWK